MKKVLVACGFFALMGIYNTAVAQTTGRGGQTQTQIETQREVKPTQNGKGRENGKAEAKGDNGKHLGHEKGKGHHKGKGKGHDHHNHDGKNHNDAQRGNAPTRNQNGKIEERGDNKAIKGRENVK